MINVSAAIIRDTYDRVLICRRSFGERAHLWEFPGGKIEQGETPEACLIRECLEELGLEISVIGLYDEIVHEYPDRRIKLFFFDAVPVFGQAQALEHEAVEWVEPRRLCEYEFCGADAIIAKRLSQKTQINKGDI